MISRGAPSFWAAYHALPADIKRAAQTAYQKFCESPAHPSLHLERLKSDPRAWAVRVTRDYRAVARRYDDDTWVWFWIGSHRDFDRDFSVK